MNQSRLFIALSILLASLLVMLFNLPQQEIYETAYLIKEPEPHPTITTSPIPTVEEVEEKKINESGNERLDIFHDVPFTVQAPFGEWHDPRLANGCEEASILMAVLWANNQLITESEAKQKIIEIAEHQRVTYGVFQDTSLEDTYERILKGYFKYTNAELYYDITTEDIKNSLVEGNPVIIPVNGRVLKNPYYTPPGPERHMLVVVGYDSETKEFITNDPGTRRGESIRYPEENLSEAIHDYQTGYNLPLPPKKTGMLVIKSKNLELSLK